MSKPAAMESGHMPDADEWADLRADPIGRVCLPVTAAASAWLPLFHLLASPLALSDTLWRTGLAGSIVSTLAFAATAWFLFRLTFEMNRNVAAAFVALATFAACPNMAYLASTPLTEPLALLWAVLVVYGLFRFQETGRRSALVWAAL